MDGGAWWAAVLRVTKSWTRLQCLSMARHDPKQGEELSPSYPCCLLFYLVPVVRKLEIKSG